MNTSTATKSAILKKTGVNLKRPQKGLTTYLVAADMIVTAILLQHFVNGTLTVLIEFESKTLKCSKFAFYADFLFF